MSDTPLPRIMNVKVLPHYKLVVSWDQFPPMTVDLTPTISSGGIFEALRDEENFARVRIGERQRTVEWPIPKDELGYPIIDIDAESLHSMAMRQKERGLFGAFLRFVKDASRIVD